MRAPIYPRLTATALDPESLAELHRGASLSENVRNYFTIGRLFFEAHAGGAVDASTLKRWRWYVDALTAKGFV